MATSVSPFTGQQQIQDWQASFLEASVSMPPLTQAQAQNWIAFLMALRGQAKVFQLGDPLAVVPQGSAPARRWSMAAGQTGYTLNLKGFTPNSGWGAPSRRLDSDRVPALPDARRRQRGRQRQSRAGASGRRSANPRPMAPWSS